VLIFARLVVPINVIPELAHDTGACLGDVFPALSLKAHAGEKSGKSQVALLVVNLVAAYRAIVISIRVTFQLGNYLLELLFDLGLNDTKQ